MWKIICVLTVLVCIGVDQARSQYFYSNQGIPQGRRNRDQAVRLARQTPVGNRDVVIDSIFQIPIQTLSAVNTLVRNTRPNRQRRRNQEAVVVNGYTYYGHNNGGGRRRSPADIAQVHTAADGSSYRI